MATTVQETSILPSSHENKQGSCISTETEVREVVGVKRQADDVGSNGSPPYHVLMLDGTNSQTTSDVNNHKKKMLILDRRFKTDYLSMRYRSYENATPKIQAENQQAEMKTHDSNFEKWWCGATWVERALTSCCTLHPDDNYFSGKLAPDMKNNKVSLGLRHQSTIGEVDEESLVAGALSIDKIAKFVGILAMHCHDIGSRALALAILEQTQEADEIELQDHYSYVSTPPPGFLDNNQFNENSQEVSNANSQEVSDANYSRLPFLNEPMGESETRVSQKRPERLTQFMNAGGLKILSQWLVEATRPIIDTSASTSKQQVKPVGRRKGSDSSNNVSAIKSKASAGSNKSTKASPTGPILLPLLLFLHTLPFDLQAITQSKINKEIRNLSKQIDTRIEVQKKKVLDGDDDDMIVSSLKDIIKPFSDPIAGGLNVLEIQAAIKKLMEIWESQAKHEKKISKQHLDAKNVKLEYKNPFAAVIDKVKSRLNELKYHEEASRNTQNEKQEVNVPEWLQKILEKQPKIISSQIAGTVGSRIEGPSLARSNVSIMNDLARRERENERAALMKQDLEKAQEERRKLLRRLRQYQQHHGNNVETEKSDKPQIADKNSKNSSNTKKRNVRWKDGYGSASRTSTRDLLEEIFLFHKDQVVLLDSINNTSDNFTGVEINQTIDVGTSESNEVTKVTKTDDITTISIHQSKEEDNDSSADEMEELFG